MYIITFSGWCLICQYNILIHYHPYNIYLQDKYNYTYKIAKNTHAIRDPSSRHWLLPPWFQLSKVSFLFMFFMFFIFIILIINNLTFIFISTIFPINLFHVKLMFKFKFERSNFKSGKKAKFLYNLAFNYLIFFHLQFY